MFAMVLSLLGGRGGSLFGAVQHVILFQTCPDLLTVFTGAKRQAHELTVM
jgi:hypothetical protein